MANSQIIAIGSVAKHRGVYDASTTYYYKNQCTMYGSVFEALSDNFSGVAPMTVADDGSVALANTTIWQCIVDNVDLYNKVLSTNALDTRVTNVETSVKELEALKEKMNVVIQDSESDAIDNYSEVLAFLKGYKDTDTLKKLMDNTNIALQDHDADIARLELKHLNPRIVFESGASVVECAEDGTSTANLVIAAITDDGDISQNNNFSDLKLDYSSAKGTLTTNGGDNSSVGLAIAYTEPLSDTIKASGSCVYKNQNVTLAEVTKTIHCVKASYIGYFTALSEIDFTGENILKIVKKNLAGSYSVTNATGGTAYLFVAVPKNGNVDAVKSIIQRSSMSVNLPFTTEEDDNYTYYVCSTGHNEGTYTFVIS